MGNGQWAMGIKRSFLSFHARCPMPHAPCPMPDAPCPE
ncbi:histidine kinase [Tolypothrix sp. VBCCA 56010]